MDRKLVARVLGYMLVTPLVTVVVTGVAGVLYTAVRSSPVGAVVVGSLLAAVLGIYCLIWGMDE